MQSGEEGGHGVAIKRAWNKNQAEEREGAGSDADAKSGCSQHGRYLRQVGARPEWEVQRDERAGDRKAQEQKTGAGRSGWI